MGGIFNLAERGLDALGEAAALGGQGEAAAGLVEQRDAEFLLQDADLMADRAVRQVEHFGRARHATMAGDHDKDAQGIERRQAFRHSGNLARGSEHRDRIRILRQLSATDKGAVPARAFRKSQNKRILRAASRSSLRKSGWAMPISASARCLALLPRNWATPYSLTT